MTITTKTYSGVIHPLQAARFGFAAASAAMRALLHRRKVRELSNMPDYILTDLGIRRDDIAQALQANWREDPSFRLSISAGKRRRGLSD